MKYISKCKSVYSSQNGKLHNSYYTHILNWLVSEFVAIIMAISTYIYFYLTRALGVNFEILSLFYEEQTLSLIGLVQSMSHKKEKLNLFSPLLN